MARVPTGCGAPKTIMLAVVGLQIVGAVFFTYDSLGPLLGIRDTPISWHLHELIEIGAAAGLISGAILGLVILLRSDAQRQAAEEKLAMLSSAFHELLMARFDDWGLTPAEMDVAFFVIKGFSTQEIAGYRQTSEGTVKAQTNAIYRKAGVTGRVQLVSLFLEDLMDEKAMPAALIPG
ncbi:helix-turn-helix transcriptional regulator [Tropicimonas sp. IMCC6043]|nr:helix-turn-helix transcriptional regulator [Tropicimonas sp. IMCC6043]